MQPPKTQMQSTILQLVEEMLQDWELDSEEPIHLDNQLIKDLNFTSVDFVQLFVAIEGKLQQKLGFHDLIMPEDKYVDDLSVAQIVAYVESKLNSPSSDREINKETNAVSSTVQSRLDENKIAQFRQTIPSPPVPQAIGGKNPPALFILSPSRSGSTLLRVMLGGHPQLFAPPELHLLSFYTLRHRREALSKSELNQHLLYGLIRAIMQIRGCSAEEAQDLLTQYEARDMTTREFYGLLQEWLGDRLLVDKTPSYAYHVNILRAAEAYFSEAIYIHLVRHPYGAIRSFEDAKIDRLLPFMQSDSFTRREYAELAWLVCQQNICEFLQDIPDNRQFRVKFEDLATEPDSTIQSLCYFLGLDFHQAMVEPYQDQNQRMTDGIGKVSTMSGDLKFYLHREIDPAMVERWKQYHSGDFLSDTTWQVARLLGYRQ
jgi:acyl carrier protein